MANSPREHSDDDAVEPEVAAQFLGISVAYVLELIELGALPVRAGDEAPMIGVKDLETYAAQRARRRPFMQDLGQIGSEQMEHERRLGLM